MLVARCDAVRSAVHRCVLPEMIGRAARPSLAACPATATQFFVPGCKNFARDVGYRGRTIVRGNARAQIKEG